MAGWNQGGLPQDFGQSGLGVAKAKAGPTRSELLRQTYKLYHQRFKTFFLISLPPATLAYFCFFLQRIIVRGLRAQGWMPSRSSPQAWIVFTLVALFEGAVYWLISAFFFAAIASNILEQHESDTPAVVTFFRMASRRPGAVAALALTLWAPFVIARGLLGFAVFSLLEYFGLLRNMVVAMVAFGIVLLLLAGLLSRWGLAIPILLDDPGASLSQSLRRSKSSTRNWGLFFMAFLVKMEILGYAAYWLMNLGLSWVYRFAFPTQDSRFRLEAFLYICLGAALESPLFIAFSLLHQHSKQSSETNQEETRPAVAIH